MSDATESTADVADGADGTGAATGTGPAEEGARLGERQHLDGRVRVQWTVRVAISSLFLGAVLYAFARGLAPQFTWVAGVASGAVFVLGVARAVWHYRVWYYVVRDDSLFLHRGVLTRVQTVVPYVRVQHVDTQTNPIERALGLSRLVVYTAGSRGADVTIPGLPPERAEQLQTRLKRLAIESEEEDAV